MPGRRSPGAAVRRKSPRQQGASGGGTPGTAKWTPSAWNLCRGTGLGLAGGHHVGLTGVVSYPHPIHVLPGSGASPVLDQHSQKDGGHTTLTVSHSLDRIISHLGLCVSQGPAGRPGKNHRTGDIQSMARSQFMNHEAYCIQLAHSTGRSK